MVRKSPGRSEARHAFLDIDHDGEVVRGRLGSRATFPPPMVVVDSSPGKLQAIWRVGASVADVEAIQRGLVEEFGGDPAATDVTRVCRLPGFLNWKYSPPVLVTATWGPVAEVEMSASPRADPDVGAGRRALAAPRPDGALSQSELDWRAVRLALARGVDPEVLIDALARSRPDKRRPTGYSQRTVRKALALSGRHES